MAILFCGRGNAASITAIRVNCSLDNEDCSKPPDAILIDGLIENGDAQKFIDTAYKIGSKRRIVQVSLRSPGGSVYEAMKIGHVVRKLLIDTFAPFPSKFSNRPYCPETKLFPARAASCVCASACFLIYAAGVPRNMAYVLLHRPYLDPSKNALLDLDSSLKVANQIRADVSSYLREMEVPDDYATIMFSTPSNNAIYIDYNSMRDRIAGYPAAIDEWLMAKCKVSSFGQEQARFDALNDGSHEKALEEIEQQRRARNLCISNALEGKRMTALVEWKQEYLQRRQSGRSPALSPAVGAPKLPPGWRWVDEPDPK
jgi:hypothetical protein